MSNRTLRSVLGLGLTLAWFAAAASAQTNLFTDRGTFESTLGSFVTDGFSADAYQHGDRSDGANLDIFSNAAMSAVLGETDYETTGFDNWNFIFNPADPHYCAGCNGSFRLNFLTTSVGNSDGVFGAGFDVLSNSAGLPYHAFITFADSSSQDVALPAGASFFGVTSDLVVSSIHLGLANGGSTTNGSFVMDNVTVGSVPEPTALSLLSLGALMLLRRKR